MVPFEEVSTSIADNQRNSYLIGLVIGVILYVILLYFNDWDLILLIMSGIHSELSIITGIFMRFLSGLGITLTFATFCVIFFRVLSPSLKGKKSRLKIAKGLVFNLALVMLIYAVYIIVGALFLSRVPSYFDFLSMIFGIWSLMVLVYIVPLIKGEYSPDIDQTKREGVREQISDWKFSIWRGYKSYIRKDYGQVAEEEFERYGSRLFIIRAILSGLLLLPLSLILIVLTPLAILGIILWIRIFSLNYKHFSKLERGLLILITASVAVVNTMSLLQSGVYQYSLFLDISYGIGLLVGLILMFVIIRRI